MRQYSDPKLLRHLSTAGDQLKKSVKAARRGVKDWERRLQAQYRRRRSRARFIAVTGSSAKTTTTALVSQLLASSFKARALVDDNAAVNALITISKLTGDEEFVVLETASAGPGQLAETMRIVKPDIAIVTMVANEHYSAFRTIEAIEAEKSEAVKALKADGLAVLNYDDPRVRAMANLTPARCVTFGGKGADYEIEPSVTKDGFLSLTVKKGDKTLVLATQLVGIYNALTVAAAVSCALELGVPDANVIEVVAAFAPYPGRMYRKVIPGGPVFIVDTRKAPYHSINLPLEALAQIEAPRKRFVLGQISDYPGNPRKKYRDTYRAASAIADEVLFVGPHHHRSGASEEDIASGRFRAFPSVQAASQYLKETATENEVILIKSSRNIHLERILLDWTEDVRCWIDACGIKTTCWSCGLYGHPFSEHNGNHKYYRPKKRGLDRLLAHLPFGARRKKHFNAPSAD